MKKIKISGKTYELPTSYWSEGEPPSTGWWPCCEYFAEKRFFVNLRFWNGSHWSISYPATFPKDKIPVKLQRSAFANAAILWSKRWWE